MKELINYIMLLSDRVRVERFRDAIAATVRPGDVVIDVGAGVGILSLYAVRAGAARCYAVEREPEVAPVARRFLAENGAADRVTVLTGLAEEVDLPEPADLVMAELLGHVGVDERIHEILSSVCRRALKPGGRVLPRFLETFLVPVQRDPAQGAVWLNDFVEPDFRLIPELRPFPMPAMAPEVRPPRQLGPSAMMERFAIADPGHVRPEAADLEIVIDRDGRLDALMAGFRADLAPGFSLADFPPYPGSNWVLWYRRLLEPMTVAAGDRFAVRVANMHATHVWDWEMTSDRLAFADGP
ncbi:MAG: methyltransferase domain-containing protein [Alphaproteobacteria bacterium]|jgi:protein arginine N-methyltransferase 1|nr:methyltransferase domain-containing protein [Alphaproteobacteria bacterium]